LGSRKIHRVLTWRLSKYAQCKVLAIDYALAPENVFPASLQDVISSFLYLTQPQYDDNAILYEPSEIVIMGDSSGGGLAMSFMLWLRDNADPRWKLAGVCILSPWIDLTHSLPSYTQNSPHCYLPFRSKDPKYIHKNRSHYILEGNHHIKHPYLSPLFATERGDKTLPPILIQVGSWERLRDESLMFASNVFANSPIRVEIYEGQVPFIFRHDGLS
jgi:epsilon-lactone hydrolase